MAVSRKVERESIRNEFLTLVSDFLVVTFKVPTGANKGLEPYDGYAEAESYELKLKEKSEKAKANAEKKAKKMARDAEVRAKKKAIAEKGNA